MEKKDFKLYGSLLLYALLPSIYLLIRMQIISINSVDINIMGQLEWFDLIDEILVTILTVPLYFLLKPDKSSDKNMSAFLISLGIYTFFTIIIMARISTIADFMQASNAVPYLFMQALSMLSGFVGTFMIMIFTLNSNDKLVRQTLVCRLALQVLADWALISMFKDVGAAYAEIVVNMFVGLFTICLAYKKGYLYFHKPDKNFLVHWSKIGVFSGVQIFLDNFIYAIMVCKMINAVSESGNYWVANNFIWGWLLVPVTCLVEIVKKNDEKTLKVKNCWKYLAGILLLWIVSMPFWKAFINGPMASNGKEIVRIVYPLIPFYVTYLISAVIDGWFISKGKTLYNAINSVIVNIGYYGIVYALFKQGIFEMNMNFIVMMFGFGMVVHMIGSIIMYKWELKKRNLSIAN